MVISVAVSKSGISVGTVDAETLTHFVWAVLGGSYRERSDSRGALGFNRLSVLALQVADGLWNYVRDSIGYRCLRYKYRQAALQVAGRAGRGEAGT